MCSSTCIRTLDILYENGHIEVTTTVKSYQHKQQTKITSKKEESSDHNEQTNRHQDKQGTNAMVDATDEAYSTH